MLFRTLNDQPRSDSNVDELYIGRAEYNTSEGRHSCIYHLWWTDGRRLRQSARWGTPGYTTDPLRSWNRRSDRSHQKETPKDGVGRPGEEAQNKAHSGDATAVSIIRDGRRLGGFAERQQLAEGAPLMRMPLCAFCSSME